MAEYDERQILEFIEYAGIAFISLVFYTAGVQLQGQPLGALLFFCPAALYVWAVKK